MRVLGALLIVVASCLAASPASAAGSVPLARATAVQPPVWIETAGNRQALAAGTVLHSGDRIATGSGGRVHIELAEDSIVKLGENADFQVPRLAMDGSDGIFKGTLKVLKGAFRFTTRALGKVSRREIDVQIGVVTAGVRGTDIWGKADRAQDLVCLLEGRIEIESQGQPRQNMNQPGTVYVVPKGRAPLPLSPAPQDRLPGWAAQTEMAEDQVTTFADGKYVVLVGTFDTPEAARREVKRLSDKGYAAEMLAPADEHYLVVTRGLGSKGEARRYARHLKQVAVAPRASFVPNF